MMYFQTYLSVIFAISGLVRAAPAPRATFGGQYPFTQMVAFGDNLSDNGNGSYAHGLADQNHPTNKIYGYGTWTNGPVAVSYLSDMIGIPLTADYAFGGADGGSKIGATINNSYTSSMYAPDGFQQVFNYTSTPELQRRDVAKTLHFLWIGNNDISLKHIATWATDNSAFANQMASQMVDLVGNLINAGSKNVFVVGLYPKHISPSYKFLASNANQQKNLGNAIAQANDAIQSRLSKKYGNKVLYYDVFDFMVQVYNNAEDYGINYVLPHFCDGYSQEDWDLCVTQHQGDQFFWMQFTDMTTYVDSLIAYDMAQAINNAYLA